MDSKYAQYDRLAEAERIVASLLTLQFVDPHAPIAEAMDKSQRQLGFCPAAAEGAMRWLGVNAETKIGRMRRTELLQLARAIHRFWQAAVESQAV